MAWTNILGQTRIGVRNQTQVQPIQSIVSSGLMLHLDSSNTLSYSGTGTSWVDLSGNNNNGTLNGSMIYSKAFSGTLFLDGGDDFVDFGNNTLLYNAYNGTFTQEFWVNMTSLSTTLKTIFRVDDWSRISVQMSSTQIQFKIGYDNGSPQSDILTYDSSFNLNQWYNVTVVWSKQSTQKIYVNGTLVAERTPLLSSYPGITGTSGGSNIGRGHTSPYSNPFNGKISIFRHYNRVLTATEILQNYNASKSKFQSTILLDNYNGSAAAYSLRKLNSDYMGSAIRVRRSSDNTEMNIGFTAGGDLDTVSLLGFVGAGNSGMVTTWYDQSGSGKNATQISSSYQPQIVINGSLVTRNGKPALYFNGDMLSVSRVFSTSNFSVFGSISGSSGQVDSVVLAQHNGTADLGRTVFMSPNNEASPYDKLKTFFNNGTSYSIKSDTSVFNGTNKLISVNSDGSGNTYQFVNSTLVGSLMNVNWTPLNTNTTIGNYGMNGASSAYIGYIGELICYTTNKLINRVDIESNINSYYSIYSQPTQFLLDTYSGASVAYSLRKLRTAYTGLAIRVRRSSDNAEQNIGFDINGNLDTYSLLAFVGSGNGFVKTWYDQSGNSRNITQTTSSSQPNIVSNGSIVLRNSKPAIKFDGSDDYLWNSSAISVALRNNFSVFSIDAPAGSYHKGIWIWRGANNNSPSIPTSSETRYIGVYPNSSKLFGDYPSAISYYVNNTSRNLTELSWDFGASTLPNANTTLNLVSLNQTSSVGNKYIVLGSDPYNIGLTTLNGCISEILFYENESTSISLINTNINSYYSIY